MCPRYTVGPSCGETPAQSGSRVGPVESDSRLVPAEFPTPGESSFHSEGPRGLLSLRRPARGPSPAPWVLPKECQGSLLGSVSVRSRVGPEPPPRPFTPYPLTRLVPRLRPSSAPSRTSPRFSRTLLNLTPPPRRRPSLLRLDPLVWRFPLSP